LEYLEVFITFRSKHTAALRRGDFDLVPHRSHWSHR